MVFRRPSLLFIATLLVAAIYSASLARHQAPPPQGAPAGKILGNKNAVGKAFKSIPIEINLDRLDYQEEDDPLYNDDEPYMINVSFRAKLAFDGLGHAKADPASIQVAPVCELIHGNLTTNSHSDWAEHGKRYRIVGQHYQTSLPDEPGWVAGMVCTFWEADEFSNNQTTSVRDRIVFKVKQSLGNMVLTGMHGYDFTDFFAVRMGSDLYHGFKDLDIVTILRSITGAVNPDDYGGMQLILVSTFGGDSMKAFLGAVSDTASFTKMNEVPKAPGMVPISFLFPTVDVPGHFNSVYGGKCYVKGFLRRKP